MARRTSTAEDIIMIASRLPWWVSLLLAGVSYVVLHHYAGIEVPKAATTAQMGDMVQAQFIKTSASFGQYILPALLGIGMLVSLMSSAKRKALRRSTAGAEPKRTLDNLGWLEFEQLVYQLFRDMGYRVEPTREGADGGVDLRLMKDGSKATVQCKHWLGCKVGVNIIREQFGIMAAEGADHGYVVTSGQFTSEAVAFARGKPLTLIDRRELKKVLRRSLNEPLQFTPVSSGPGSPSCPKCQSAMTQRTARRGKKAGSDFWGCTRYPACRGTRDS